MEEADLEKAGIEEAESSKTKTKKKRIDEISVPLWTAIATAVAGVIVSLVTANSNLRQQNLQAQAQFNLERQKFEFSLISQALKVDPSAQIFEKSEQSSEASNNAQEVSVDQQDPRESFAEQDEKDRKRAAEELLFLVDIGIIQSLDADKVRARAEDPASLPRLKNTRPYCFLVNRPTNVYSSPSFDSVTADRYAVGDTAYATTNPPTSVWVKDDRLRDGNLFVEISLYGGNVGWIPRFSASENASLLIDLPSSDCPNPGPGAAGF